MEKIAFKMKLKPGCQEEYRKRHAAIWPALLSVLKESKISDYTIFLDNETDILFAVQKKSGYLSSQGIGEKEVMKKWWHYMADIMETNEDYSPISKPLEMMFHLD